MEQTFETFRKDWADYVEYLVASVTKWKLRPISFKTYMDYKHSYDYMLGYINAGFTLTPITDKVITTHDHNIQP